MAELFNVQTQKVETVDDERALEYLNSQQFNLPSQIVTEGNVGMVSPEGEVYEVPLGDVRGALGDMYRLETIGERKQRNARIEVDDMGVLAYPAAAAAGVGKALSFGTSSLALGKSGIVEPEKLAALEEELPYVQGGAELATVLGTAFFTGGGSLLARGATAPLRGAMALSHKAGLAVGKEVGKVAGQKTLGKLAEKSVQYGVEGALDNALFAGGNYLHEVALDKAEFSGQALVSHIGSEAGTGLLFGGALGVAAVPGRAAINWGKKNAKLLAKIMPSGADTRRWEEIQQSADPLKEMLEDQAGSQALQSLGLRQTHFRELLEKGGGDLDTRYDAAKKWLFEQNIIEGATSLEDAQRRIHVLAEEAGDEIKRFYSEVDRLHQAGDAGRGTAWQGMRFDDFIESLEEVAAGLNRDTEKAFKSEIVDKINFNKNLAMDRAGIPKQIKRLDANGAPILDAETGAEVFRPREFRRDYQKLDMADRPELSLEEAVHRRNGYDAKANFGATDPDFKKRSYRQIYAKVNERIHGAAERTAREVHDDLVDVYQRDPFVYNGEAVVVDDFMEGWKRNKQNFGIADDLREMMGVAVAAESANRKISLTDYMAAGIGGGAIAALGPVPGIAAGVGVALGHRFVKKYGHSMAAGQLSRLARLSSIQNGAANRLRASAVEFVGGPAKRSFMPVSATILQQTFGDVEGVTKPTRSDYARHAATQLSSLASNPELLASKIAPMIEELEPLAPELAASVGRTQAKKVAFLNEKAKALQSPVEYNTLQPQLYADMPIDPSKLASFERTVAAAGDFVGTVERELASGAVSAETVEVGDQLYDRLLDQVRVDIQAELGAKSGSVAQYNNAALSTLFGGGVIATRGRDFQARQSLVWAVKGDENRIRATSLAGIKRAPKGTKKTRTELLTQTPAASMQERLG